MVDFATTVTLETTPHGGDCPNPIQATVSMPPVRMMKSSTTYPKGKRFDFSGIGGNPTGFLSVKGKINSGFRMMEGGVNLGGSGTIVVSPGVICRTGNVHYTVFRVGPRR